MFYWNVVRGERTRVWCTTPAQCEQESCWRKKSRKTKQNLKKVNLTLEAEKQGERRGLMFRRSTMCNGLSLETYSITGLNTLNFKLIIKVFCAFKKRGFSVKPLTYLLSYFKKMLSRVRCWRGRSTAMCNGALSPPELPCGGYFSPFSLRQLLKFSISKEHF